MKMDDGVLVLQTKIITQVTSWTIGEEFTCTLVPTATAMLFTDVATMCGTTMNYIIFTTIKIKTMKTYIGIKQVKAEPMDELAAVEKGFARKNEDNHEWRQGYHVQYTNPDGSVYDSWSPKSVFEQAYKCADNFLDRLLIEHDELKERYDKLDKFIESGKVFKECDAAQALMIATQRIFMGMYLHTLDTRIKDLKEHAPSQTQG